MTRLATAVATMAFAVTLTASAMAGDTLRAPRGYGIDTFDIDAEAAGRSHRVFVAAPSGAAGPAPVIYLLDGNTTFPLMLAALEEWRGEKPVVVGIGYPTDAREEIVARRYFDLTPETPAERIPLRPGSAAPETGGRDRFLSIIRDRIMPEVERRTVIDPARRTLFGHSLGGLFALHAMTGGEAFRTIVAADPSLWWNGHGDMTALRSFAATGTAAEGTERLLILRSGRQAERPGLSAEQKQRLAALRGGPGGGEAAALLETVAGLEVRFERYDDATHGSMLPRAVADALAFALEDR